MEEIIINSEYELQELSIEFNSSERGGKKTVLSECNQNKAFLSNCKESWTLISFVR